jgi:DNA-binding transcriptional MerR regulator
MNYFTIKEAADMLGVRVSNIRYWDDKYSVIATREENTDNRLVSPAEIKTFTKIKLLLNFFNSEGVKLVLEGKVQVTVEAETLKNYG